MLTYNMQYMEKILQKFAATFYLFLLVLITPVYSGTMQLILQFQIQKKAKSNS